MISDISNPDQFQKDLQSKFNIDMTELLHVRSFLDHNRIYMDVRKYKKSQNLTSSCAYSHKGEHLNSSKITSNLIEFEKVETIYNNVTIEQFLKNYIKHLNKC